MINYIFNQNNINKWRKNKVLWIILDISFENKWKDYKKNTQHCNLPVVTQAPDVFTL